MAEQCFINNRVKDIDEDYNFGGGSIQVWLTWLVFAVVQTKPKAPAPIRTPKLSGFRHG